MKNSTNAKKCQELSPKQLKAVELLISGKSGTDVAKEIGVHPSTISIWKLDPTFKSTMNVLLREQNEAFREKFRSLGNDALKTIQEVIKDGKTPAKDHLTTALKIIEMLGIDFRAKNSIGITDPNVLMLNSSFNYYPEMDEEKSLEELRAYIKGIPVNGTPHKK